VRSVRLPALFAALLAALPAMPALAADGVPPVLARLKSDLSLTDADVAALQTPVQVHLSRGGREQGLRELLGSAVASGCRGPCAAEVVRAATRARSSGMPPMDAIQAAKADLAGALAAGAPEGGPPDEAALAEAVRTRMEARLGAWHPEAAAMPESPPSPPTQAPAANWPPKRPRLP
jgi:hypothetical protein